MNDVLHAGALGSAVLSTAALCTARDRAGMPERLCAALMLIGMADAMTTSLLSPLLWFSLMIAAGMALAAVRRRRPSEVDAHAGSLRLSTHLAFGLVTTGALILLMQPMAMPGLHAAVSGHTHGGAVSLNVVCAALALTSVAFATTALRSSRSWRHRIHHVAMGVSTAAMSIAVLA